MSKGKVAFNKTGIFAADVVRHVRNDAGFVSNKNASMLSGTNISTSSFNYDAPGTGLKSTQQIPLDWSDFSNHTFFNSAEANVNVAFERIINHFPFDGSSFELQQFLDSLTGFEKHVYDQFPKHLGYLVFSGTSVDENPANGHDADLGTSIRVADFAGSLFPDLSRDQTGRSVIDPKKGSFACEMELFIPSQSIDSTNQVILQKISGSTHGFTLGLSGSKSHEGSSPLFFIATSGSAVLSCSADLQKDRWHHVCATYNRSPGKSRLEIYVNERLKSISDRSSFGDWGFALSPLTIGSGSLHITGSTDNAYVPRQTFSGSIDELRMFHSTRDIAQQRTYRYKNIFPTEDDKLVLYFKFNEASGSYTNNNVVLDSSGKSLHSRIKNYTEACRLTTGFSSSSIQSPMILERVYSNPVLFPDSPDVIQLNTSLLLSASFYDANNPNLITKLVPKHYLLEQASFEGFENEDGDIADPYSYDENSGIPGGGKMGSPQIVAALLFTWAQYFDEMKIFLDHFSNLLHVDYDDDGTVADQFLPFLGEYYGFTLPNMFSNSSLSQLVDGENLGAEPGLSSNGLQTVQNQIWRRILVNLNEIIQSKGTIHSIKALMRSSGISPDKIFRFREFGGAPKRDLTEVRKKSTTVSSLLDMSGSLKQYTEIETISPQGLSDRKPHLVSPFLSGTRVEPGYPTISHGSAFVRNPEGTVIGTTRDKDGLLTSGSWTYEAIYKYEPIDVRTGFGGVWRSKVSHPLTQSLMRMYTTGSSTVGDFGPAPGLLVNVLAFQSSSHSTTASLKAYVRAGTSQHSPTLEFNLPGVNIFDGNKWHITFGRERNDQFNSIVSSSYFLRAGRQSFGDLAEYKSSSVLFEEDPLFGTEPWGSSHLNVRRPGGIWQDYDSRPGQPWYNVSGSFFLIGSQSIRMNGSDYSTHFLNSYASDRPDLCRYTMFTGRVGRIRFWSKALAQEETREHARNFKSLGVQDPSKNFNFVKTRSGSFQKVRIDASVDQYTTSSNEQGKIDVFDYSQNNMHISGSSFEISKRIIKPERFDYSMLDPKFDEFSQDNKVRVRSWQNWDNVSKYGGEVAPVYEIRRSEQPVDDTRFAIEVSSVQALNEDIVNIFSTFDALDNALGNPELLFSTEYPELAVLREVYFNRLDEKINLRSFFEFFKWFDSSLGILIDRLVPRRTKFLGVNFIVESHMLERAKFNYGYSDMYIGENNRHGLKGTILLRQLVGTMKRF